MSRFPVRRAQLVSPFGVGALQVSRDGTSVITAGLDHWYEREDGSNDSRTIDMGEYVVEEWRLEQMLGVKGFRLPPDFRVPRTGEQVPNCNLTVPFLRFPTWHFCPKCKRLIELPLTVRGRQKCTYCEAEKKTSYLAQVPFVAICELGHIQDFPWREWVHESATPSCQKMLRLVATGGASLAAQKIECECGAERTLASITMANPDRTTELSKTLDKGGKPYLCQGNRPWLGSDSSERCECHVRGSLRSAANLYFADVRSAIYLPRSNDFAPPDLVELLENEPLSTLVDLLSQLGGTIEPKSLRAQHSQLLQPYSDAQIKNAVGIVLPGKSRPQSNDASSPPEDLETAFRRQEYLALQTPRTEQQLTVRSEPMTGYEPALRRYFAKIMLVTRLRETRAFAGFTRVHAENDQTLAQRRSLLWLNVPAGDETWLPAYKVYGEGIFLELSEGPLQRWENREEIRRRVEPLINRYRDIQASRKLRDRPIGPRFVLLHTLAHLLINRLTFASGYSSAALRERLYISDNPQSPMAGILIYTAAGDADGTLGGLVRMGKPGILEPVVRYAIEAAKWCSVDPVCMEIGKDGQGPDSCNLAACHNCALIPETACEEFNRFLDRALVVGELGNSNLGYFSDF